jgi:bifunctional NMN adenylyltransferase/nudix hydrolase
MQGCRYRFAVWAGRFQPFHYGHATALKRGLALADHLIVVIGSSRRPRSPLNPWTAAEREEMIRGSSEAARAGRVHFLHLQDHLYNDDLWAAEVGRKVAEAAAGLGGGGPVTLLGPSRDEEAWRGRFPHWPFEPVPVVPALEGEAFRAAYFSGIGRSNWAVALPRSVSAFLRSWEATPEYGNLADEWSQIAAYRARWSQAPFPVVFTTVDTLVLKSGHALLVRRRAHPGKGLLALPGGFLDAEGDRSLRAGALRELREETGITVADADLLHSIRAERAFDAPERSLRGRTITHVVCMDLGEGPLPEVQGGDDASQALWVALADLREHPEELFEDHADIIANLTQAGSEV